LLPRLQLQSHSRRQRLIAARVTMSVPQLQRLLCAKLQIVRLPSRGIHCKQVSSSIRVSAHTCLAIEHPCTKWINFRQTNRRGRDGTSQRYGLQ
jgi:hypothetical protein